MTITEQPRKTELIDRLVDLARRKHPRQGDDLERFVRDYFALVSPDDMDTDPESLLGGALSLWEFGETREPGKAKVRILTPTVAQHGWTVGHTIIEIVNDDMPFLVDSISGELINSDRNIHLIIHPIVRVARDANGRRTSVLDRSADSPDGVTESYMHYEIDEETDSPDLAALRTRLE